MTQIKEEIIDNSGEMDIFGYAKQVIALQLEMKEIQSEIKIIKNEAKDEGVMVKEIDAAITLLKKEAKYTPGEKRIAEEVLEELRENSDILNAINQLVN